MPDGQQYERYVTYDRWDAEHQALREREESAHQVLRDRLAEAVADLSGRIDAIERHQAERRNRQWSVALTMLASLVLPLLLTAILALITALRR